MLLKKYGKKKLFLLGHSWGSVLGVRVAQHRPELLYAYIGVGQVVNMRRNEAVGYQMTLAAADAAKNKATTPEPLAFDFYNRIHAPDKRFFKIEGASHYVFNEAPGEMLMDLVLYARPVFSSDKMR